jgi:hypothetical protein
MADLISYTIPNLIQGVTQQPDAQRDPTQGEIQVNAMSSIAEGLRKRDSSHTLARVSATSFGDAFIHTILRDSTEEYLAVITKTGIRVFDLMGVERTVAAPGGYDYLSTVTDARQQIRAVTIADYTFVLNTTRATAMETALAPAIARPSPHEALIWVRAANYGQSYSVTVNGKTATVTTAVAPVISNGTTVTENRISTAEIANQIKTGIGTNAGVVITRSGSVLWLQSSSPITIAATDARANSDITAILGKVQAFTELPTIAPKGYQVEIVGDPGNNFDGYYVEFRPKSGNFGEGVWAETVSPGVEYKVNATTMPHVLVRLPDGTFWFGPAAGATAGGVIKVPTWGQRTTGDYVTAPDPSFIGNPINDVFIYKNRLGFLSDENVVLSRVREFFEFFPETVTTVLDTDPIDVVASNNRVSVLRYAVPYQDELILFSSQYQFRFNAAETVLTPSTAQITVLTQFDVDVSVRPQQAGGSIIFCQANGQWSQFREFSVRGSGTALTADAQDLTGYVSAYVPAGIFKMTVNDASNSMFAISQRDGFKDRIYVYKFFFRNTGQGAERAQSSWSHWEFNGADEVLQVVCIRENLYCLMRYGDEVYLEVIPVMDRMSEVVGGPYPLLLDRRVSTTVATQAGMRMAKGVFNAVANQTTWTLPYTARALTQVWSAYSYTPGAKVGGVLLGSTTTGNTVTARGDWSAADVFAGEPFNFRYRFSRFKLVRDIGGGKAAANAIRTQVRQAKLRYHETGFFQIKVMPEHRDTFTYTYDGAVIASRGAVIGSPKTYDQDTPRYFEGVFNIPIMSRGERCMVEIHNDTPHPCKFSTCEWVGLATGKSRSMQ